MEWRGFMLYFERVEREDDERGYFFRTVERVS